MTILILTLLMLVLIVPSFILCAQHVNEKIDSLETILELESDPKTRVDILLEIAKLQSRHDLVQSQEVFAQAYEEAKELGYNKGQVKALNTLGSMFARSGAPDTAITMYSQSLKLIDGSEEMVPEALNAEYGIGTAIFRLGLYDSAIHQFDRLKSLAQTYQDKESEAKALLLLGLIHNNEGRYYQSLSNQLDALRITEEIGDLSMQSMLLNNIATVYYDIGEKENCLKYLKKSLKMADESDLRHQANVISNISGVESDLGKLKEAIAGYDQAIAIRKTYGDSCSIGPDLNSLASIYLKKLEVDQAKKLLFRAAELNKICNDQDSYIVSLQSLGNIEFQADSYTEAEAYFQQVFDLASKHGINDKMSESAERLYEINRDHFSKPIEALKYLEIHNELADSLADYADERKIAQLEAKYTFDKEKAVILAKNEKEDLIQQQRLQNQQYWIYSFIVGLILVIALAIIFYRNYRQRTKANQFLALKNDEISKQKNQLDASNQKLKELSSFKETMTGMIAHDLKNPLGIIMNTEDQSGSTKHMAAQMLNLVNNMLDVHKFESTKVELKQEPLGLSHLLESAIDQVRVLLSEKNIHIKMKGKHPKFSVLADSDYLFRVMINFLTNAIKYSHLNSNIDIHITELENKVEVAVQDYGRGIPEEFQEMIFDAYGQADPEKSGQIGSTGLGLTFCKLVLRAHGSDIQVDSQKGKGTRFTFQLPLSKEYDLEIATTEQKDAPALVLTPKEKEFIHSKLPQLRAMKMHQVLELEAILEEIEQESEAALTKWAQEVVNAAYADNKSRYEELINQV